MLILGTRVYVGFNVSLFPLPQSGITEMYGSSIYSFLRKPPHCLPPCCINFHSHHHWTIILFSPHLCQILLFIFFLFSAILTDNKWCLIMVFICISLIVILSIFSCTCWLSVCLFWKMSIQVLFPEYFPQLIKLSFHFINFFFFFALQKLLCLIRSHLFIFCIGLFCLVRQIQKILLQFLSKHGHIPGNSEQWLLKYY